MKTAGVIEVKVTNRSDGVPILKLEAKDKGGRKFLTRLEEGLRIAQLIAIPEGKADIHNVCGSSGTVTPDERSSLSIALALGGIGLGRYPERKVGKKQG